MKYILYRKIDNKVWQVLDKEPISISNDLAIAQAETIPNKYDWLTVANVREQTDTWTEKEQVEKVNEKGETVYEEVKVEKSKTYMVCDLVANFYPPLTEEQIAIQKEKRYQSLCEKYIREKYSLSDELKMSRIRDEQPELHAEYNAYVKSCLERAHLEVYGI